MRKKTFSEGFNECEGCLGKLFYTITYPIFYVIGWLIGWFIYRLNWFGKLVVIAAIAAFVVYLNG